MGSGITTLKETQRILSFRNRQIQETPETLHGRDRYCLEEAIGKGSFSTVHRVYDKMLQLHRAAKIISFSTLSAEDIEFIESERKILSYLNHPNVLRLHDSFRTKNELWLILDLIEGGDVFDRITRKAYYTELEARNLAKVLLETIAYIHDQGIVHRDLKPENLLLVSNSNDFSIKICDFGFAKYVRELNFPHEDVCGTPNFVSPEVLRSQPYTTEPDVWAMGVIFYILLAGYPPFYSTTQAEAFRKIKSGKYVFHPDFWSDISHDAKDLITKMLCVDAKKRWTARELLNHPWILMKDNQFSSRNIMISQEIQRQMRVRRGSVSQPLWETPKNTALGPRISANPGDMPTRRFEGKSKRRSSVMITQLGGERISFEQEPRKFAYFSIDPSLVMPSASDARFDSKIDISSPINSPSGSQTTLQSPTAIRKTESNVLNNDIKQNLAKRLRSIAAVTPIVEETSEDNDNIPSTEIIPTEPVSTTVHR